MVKVAKKLFTVSVVTMTILWSVGFAALVPATVLAVDCPVLEAGDLFKVAGNSAVYLLNADMERMYFPNGEVYKTWYADYSGVQEIPNTCVDAYPAPGSAPYGVNYRAGSRMVKVEISPSVYVIEPGNVRSKIASEEAAIALYGAGWASMVRDIADVYWPNFASEGAELDGEMLHNGMLVYGEDGTTVYSVVDGMLYSVDGDLAIASEVQTVSATLLASLSMAGETVTPASMVEDASQLGNMPTETGDDGEDAVVYDGELSVSLSASTPDSSVYAIGASVDLLALNFKAGADAVSITGLVVGKSSLMVNADIEDIGIYVDGVRYGSLKDSFDSSNEMNFNFSTALEVPANSTITAMINGRVNSATGSYLGVSLKSVTTEAEVSDSLPISGNVMSIAGGVVAGALYVDSPIDGSGTYNFGDDDVSLASFTLEATTDGTTSSDEDVLWSAMVFENGGNAGMAAVNNIRLVVDGEEVATGDIAGDKVYFDFDAVEVEKGEGVDVELLGDLVNGEVGDTLKFFVYGVTAVGQDMGYAAATDFTLLDKKSDTGVNTITLGAGDITINFDKSAATGIPATEVRPDTQNVVLAILEMTSNDENVTIDSIDDTTSAPFEIAGSGLIAADISNVELHEIGGGTYDITEVYSSSNFELLLDEEIYLVKGVTKRFEVRADVAAAITNGDSLYVSLDADAISHEGEISGSTALSFTPNTIQSATTDIETASLEMTNVKLTNVTVVGGASDVEIYKGQFEAGAAADIKLTSVKVSGIDASSDNEDTLFSDTNISQLRLYVDGVEVSSKSNSIAEAATNADVGSITFNALSVVIPAGETHEVFVKADFASTLSGAGEFALNVTAVADVIAKTATGDVTTLASTQKTVNGATTESRQVTLASVGFLQINMSTSDLKSNRNLYLLAGDSTPEARYAGELEFAAENEAVQVKTLILTNRGTATVDDIATLELVDADGTSVFVAPFEGVTTTFDNFNYEVPADSTVSLYVKVNAKGKNVEGDAGSTATAGRTLGLIVAGATAKGLDTETALTMTAEGDGTPTTGANKYDDTDYSVTSTLMTAVVTSVTNSLEDGALTGGTGRIIGKYTVTVDNGDNRNTSNQEQQLTLTTMILNIATSTNATVTSVQAYIEGDSSNKTTAVTHDSSNDVTISFATLSGDAQLLNGGVYTIVITATVTTDGEGEYVQTELDALSTDFTWSGGAANGGDSLLSISEVIGANLSD